MKYITAILALTSSSSSSLVSGSAVQVAAEVDNVDENGGGEGSVLSKNNAPRQSSSSSSNNGQRRLRRNDSIEDSRSSDTNEKTTAVSANNKNQRTLSLSSTQQSRPPRLPNGQQQQQETNRQTQSTSNAAPGCGPTSGTHHSPYIGCYTDKLSDRAFPFQLYADSSTTNKDKGHGALDCERECTSRGYRYIGREFKGQCFCGNNLDDIVRHGMDSGCNCCGYNVGSNKMCVWEVS